VRIMLPCWCFSTPEFDHALVPKAYQQICVPAAKHLRVV